MSNIDNAIKGNSYDDRYGDYYDDWDERVAKQAQKSSVVSYAKPKATLQFKASGNVDKAFKYAYLFRLSSKQVLDASERLLRSCGYLDIIRDKNNNYVYARGNMPICLVSHTDTVFTETPKMYYDKNENVIWSKKGLGADDRAGVAAIHHIITENKKGDQRPHILFVNFEESGGDGTREFIKAVSDCPSGINLIIELDRRGKKDAVFYDCDNPLILEYLEKFGFSEAYGTFSDIAVLCPAWKVGGVNLSIGYYNEHTALEYFKIDEWQTTVKRVQDILSNPPDKLLEYIPDEWAYPSYNGYWNNKLDSDMTRPYLEYTMSELIDDMIMIYGGTYIDWFEWLLDNDDIESDTQDFIYNSIDARLQTSPPDFIIEGLGEEEKEYWRTYNK